jgi:HAD superfamily hydrolase (TIGR01509 family)
MKPIRGVAFDMDGVLFDTERLNCELWLKAFKEDGVETDMEVMKRFSGVSSEAAYPIMEELFGQGHDYREIDAGVLRGVRDYIEENGIPLKPGIFETLEYLKKRGFKIALATSTIEREAKNFLEIAGITDYFHGLVCGDSIENSKPAPDIYIKAAEIMGLDPEECIAVEDAPAGIRSANAAGMLAVMIPDQIQPDTELMRFIYRIVPTLSELIPLLEE